jgi:hypothetical protein
MMRVAVSAAMSAARTDTAPAANRTIVRARAGRIVRSALSNLQPEDVRRLSILQRIARIDDEDAAVDERIVIEA